VDKSKKDAILNQMNFFTLQPAIQHIVIAAIIVVGSLIVGFVFERVILAWMKRVAKKTSWKGDDVIVEGIKGSVVQLFFLWGLWWALKELEIQHIYIQQIFIILGIIIVTRFVEKILVGFVKLITEKSAAIPETSIFSNLIRIIVFSIGALVILQSLGIQITAVLGALGIGGLAIALAVKDTVSNLFAGLQILSSKQLSPGDSISVSGDSGTITDITWRYTTLRSLTNKLIMIPNSKLSSATIIKNSHRNKEQLIFMKIGVSYDSKLEKVEKVTREVAEEVLATVDSEVKPTTPTVRFSELGDSAITVSVGMKLSNNSKQFELKHQFIKAIHERYKKEKIDIPYPTQTIKLQKR